jgi:hypothetical protein
MGQPAERKSVDSVTDVCRLTVYDPETSHHEASRQHPARNLLNTLAEAALVSVLGGLALHLALSARR